MRLLDVMNGRLVLYLSAVGGAEGYMDFCAKVERETDKVNAQVAARLSARKRARKEKTVK